MFGPLGLPSTAASLPAWTILFAREPEPDTDMDDTGDEQEPEEETQDEDSAEEESDEMEDADEDSDEEPPKPFWKRPVVLALLGIVTAAGIYLAMDPGAVTDNTGAGPAGDQAAPTTPNAAAPPTESAGSAAPPMTPSPDAASTQAPKPADPNPSTTATMGPLFSEGQLVAVVPDPTLPAAAVALSGDADRKKPGPMVSPSDPLTVVDGEFKNNAWIYAVRTQQGTVGWAGEQQLRATP